MLKQFAKKKKITMKTWFIADTHFGDRDIMRYEKRPFQTLEEMDRKIIEWWQEMVSDEDKIFVVGDFSEYPFTKTKEILSQLTGHKFLVMGNHDKKHTPQWWRDAGFEEVSLYPILINEFIVLTHEPPQYFNDATPFFYVYGHVHGTNMYKDITRQSACVCVERTGYAPLSLESINLKLENQEF